MIFGSFCRIIRISLDATRTPRSANHYVIKAIDIFQSRGHAVLGPCKIIRRERWWQVTRRQDVIKETEAQNTCNYGIDNAKRASNCQLNCFEYRAVFKSTAPTRRPELKTKKGGKKKGTRAVYKTTDDRVRIENCSETLSRGRMDGIDFFWTQRNLGIRVKRVGEMKIKIKRALSIITSFFFSPARVRKTPNVCRSYRWEKLLCN